MDLKIPVCMVGDALHTAAAPEYQGDKGQADWISEHNVMMARECEIVHKGVALEDVRGLSDNIVALRARHKHVMHASCGADNLHFWV